MQNSGIDVKNKLYLMVCELHNPEIHGKTNDSDPNIENHYLVFNRYDPITGISFNDLDEYLEFDTDDEYETDDEMDNIGLSKIEEEINYLRNLYSSPSSINIQEFRNHPTIRNYYNIITRPNYIKPEIGEYIVLPTQEAIAILKTFWIRIIQKKWKKIYEERQNIIKKRCNLYNLSIKEIEGKWPKSCFNLPGLKGMLCSLKK
jgi:hypothetical protein